MRNLKKLCAFLAILAFAVLLTGCGRQNDGAQSSFAANTASGEEWKSVHPGDSGDLFKPEDEKISVSSEK